MRKLLLVAMSTLIGVVPAQQTQDSDAAAALAASKKRLESALAKTASLQDTAFTAEWGPDKKPKQDDNPFAAIMTGQNTGKVSGSWHPKLAICKYDGDQGDEAVTAGRRTIVRSDDHEWVLRAGRFADGNNLGFAPDVELLLQQLADWKLAVVHRDVGSIDDRPVETITVTLNADQVTEAVWSGSLPPALVTGFAGNVFRFAALGGGGGGGRQAADEPKAVVDIAIAIDPATSLVHRLHCRAYAEQNGPNIAMRGGVGRVIVQGGAVQLATVEDADEDAEEEVAEDGPLQFEAGLPKRARKKTSVTDFTVRLSDHGTKTAPELTDAQKKALRITK